MTKYDYTGTGLVPRPDPDKVITLDDHREKPSPLQRASVTPDDLDHRERRPSVLKEDGAQFRWRRRRWWHDPRARRRFDRVSRRVFFFGLVPLGAALLVYYW